MIRPALFVALAALSACGGDETVSGYADRDAVYALEEIDGAPFAATATIRFPEPGQAGGDAPCNAWTARQTAPYPWLALGPIAATERACPDLAQEARFLEVLEEMTLAEVQGPVLILSNEAGREMVFRAQD